MAKYISQDAAKDLLLSRNKRGDNVGSINAKLAGQPSRQHKSGDRC